MRSLGKWFKRLNKNNKNKIHWLNRDKWSYLGI